MTDAYEPRPGAAPARAIAYLREHGPQRHGALCKAIRLSRTQLHASTRSARLHGALVVDGPIWSVPKE